MSEWWRYCDRCGLRWSKPDGKCPVCRAHAERDRARHFIGELKGLVQDCERSIDSLRSHLYRRLKELEDLK